MGKGFAQAKAGRGAGAVVMPQPKDQVPPKRRPRATLEDVIEASAQFSGKSADTVRGYIKEKMAAQKRLVATLLAEGKAAQSPKPDQ